MKLTRLVKNSITNVYHLRISSVPPTFIKHCKSKFAKKVAAFLQNPLTLCNPRKLSPVKVTDISIWAKYWDTRV